MPDGILSNLREQQSHLWLPQAPFAAWIHAHPCFWLCSLVSNAHHAAGRGSMVVPFQRQGNT